MAGGRLWQTRVAIITNEDVAALPERGRAAALLALMREDMETQGMVLLTAGSLRTAAPLLPLLHEAYVLTEPRQLKGRNLFVIERRG